MTLWYLHQKEELWCRCFAPNYFFGGDGGGYDASMDTSRLDDSLQDGAAAYRRRPW